MKTIPIKVWNRIEMLQEPTAAIACASASDRKRWILIDIRRDSIVPQPPHRYIIVDTEFDVALLTKYIESGDEDLAIMHQTRYFATDVTGLYMVLANLEVNPELFTAPWRADYPL